jgi:F0F1-type ATP synthase assembly protein I
MKLDVNNVEAVILYGVGVKWLLDEIIATSFFFFFLMS